MLVNRLLSAAREAAYRRKFLDNRDENLFMGSFESFAAAEASAPASRPVGYASVPPDALYSHQTCFYDYPGFFWLERSLEEGMRHVFDLGGHVGIKYYALRRVLAYPEDLRWTVCDLPAVVTFGRELAHRRAAAEQLRFTTEYRDASGYDVLYLSGSLQYLPTRIGEIIADLQVKPGRVILNVTAVHPERTLYTLNSIGFAICPYRIQHYDQLLAELSQAGYKRRDAWRNEGKPIEVPFVDGGDKAYYAGCCFDLPQRA